MHVVYLANWFAHPTQPADERKNLVLGAASALTSKSILEIGRRPTATRSFGKIVTFRFDLEIISYIPYIHIIADQWR